MNIIFKGGPCDGEEMFVFSEENAIIVKCVTTHLYKKTQRRENDCTVFQYIGICLNKLSVV